MSELVLRLGGGYDAKALWVWNNEDGNIDQGFLRLRWAGQDPRSLFNIAYRTRGKSIDQADLSFSQADLSFGVWEVAFMVGGWLATNACPWQPWVNLLLGQSQMHKNCL